MVKYIWEIFIAELTSLKLSNKTRDVALNTPHLYDDSDYSGTQTKQTKKTISIKIRNQN